MKATDKQSAACRNDSQNESAEVERIVPGEPDSQFRRLADNAPIGILTCDTEGNITFVNAALVTIVGSPSAEDTQAINMLTYEPLMKAGIADDINKCLKQGTKVTAERPYCSRWGRDIVVRIIATPLIGDSGTIDGAQLLLEDITERVQTDLALRRSEAQYRLLANNAPIGIVTCDTTGKITYINPCTAQILGAPDLAELRKINLLDDDIPVRAGLSEIIRKSLESGEASASEFLHETTWGKRVVVRVHVTKVVDPEGGTTGVQLLVEDITERKRAEDKLRRERDFNYNLVQATSALFVTVDPKGKLLMTNQAFLKAAGVELEDALGALFVETFVPPREVDQFLLGFDSMRETGKQVNAETHLLTEEDGPLLIEWRGRPVFAPDGDLDFFLLAGIDITAKKAMQAEAWRLGQLASLGELAAGVAHEINNPVNGIINYAQILADQAYDDPVGGDVPMRIIREGIRIEKIVRNLLTFARSRKEEYAPTQLGDVLSDSLGLMNQHMAQDGITVNLNLPQRLPAANAGAHEIQQVLMNILSNARYALNQKYGSESSVKEITVTGRTLFEGDEQFVALSIRDNGAGLAKHVRERICEPFSTTKPKGEGTGLGMSISHGIVMEHHGRLLVDTQEGQFTEVTVALPVAFRIGESG